MNGKLHLSLAIAAGIGATPTLMETSDPAVAVVFVSACAFGSLFPDFDCEDSILGSKTFGLSNLIENKLGHRGLLHTPFFLFILWLIFLFGTKNQSRVELIFVMHGFSIGFICHLVQDTMTKGGISWLYPICKKKIHLTNFSSRNKIHIPITMVLIVLMIPTMIGLSKNFVR